MKPKTSLVVSLVVALAGLIFSGYLSYYTLLGPGCTKAIISCGTHPVKILGIPQCVFGFVMYLVVAALAAIALPRLDKKSLLKSIFIISIVGMLFTASLSVYELFVIETGVKGLPACVYGFFMYAIIFVFSIPKLIHYQDNEQPPTAPTA